MNGFVGDVRWFSGRNVAPSYNGNVLRAVRSHLNYLINHDVVDSSFQKQDIGRIIEDLKQYQTRWDARVGGKFFMSLPNDFPIQEMKNFIEKTLPMPIQFDYSVHRSKNKDGQENLHVHVFLRPVNAETGYKLQWKKSDYSQLHKNYKATLKQYGYDLVTHKDKGEEPSIHVGQRAHYQPEAQEYLQINRELGELERKEEQAMQEKGIPEEAKERYKRLNKEQKKTFWERYIEARKEVEKFFPEEPSGSILIDLFIFVLNLLFVSEEEYHKYWAEFEKQLRQSELDELKKLPPEKVLGALNIQYKKQGNAFVFSAPYRSDETPSCRIEFSEKHQDWHWVVFGTNQRGTYIDLLLNMGYSYKQALNLLRKVRQDLSKNEAGQRSLTLATGSVSLRQSAPPKERHGEKEVNLNVISKPAKEVPEVLTFLSKTRGYKTVPDWLNYYKVEKDGKVYTGYGTTATNGSIHLRFLGNASFKELCIGNSSFTHIKQGNSNTCYIVEGVHDAIALWSYGVKNDDILILNGVGNAKQVLNAISNYRQVIIATDMDKAGQETAQIIASCLRSNQKAFRLVTKAKDVDEEYRNGNKPVLRPVNIRKTQER